MQTTRLSSKGQIILPKEIRDLNAWKPGTEFTVQQTAGGVLLRPVARFPRTTLDQVVGSLVSTRKPPTEREMKEAVAKAVKSRHDRGRY